ncbi:MAG: phosphoenolpyruvate synthase [Dehalococcoidia bacterium]
MTTDIKSIVWFGEVGKADVALVGGKGANLGELVRAQIPVPPGFIISTGTYSQFLHETGLLPVLEQLLSGLDVDDSDELQRVAAQVRQAIVSAPMPERIAAEIRDAYGRLGAERVAVRSSATAEDLKEASFAGQQATYLNVAGAGNVVAAVQRCWASLFEARAIFYREQSGWDQLSVRLAVPVQQMVQSVCSGVMFTIEPVRNDPSRIVIEAVYGLGEAAVSGQISPDHYEVARESLKIVETQIVAQDRQLVCNPGAASGEFGNVWAAVEPALRELPKLTQEQVRQLTQLGLQVERHYGAPQDIEWAWADGQFYLLQTRPVTTTDTSYALSEPAPVLQVAPILTGSPASPGVASGRVRLLRDPADVGKLLQGEVLVAEMTTPDYVPAMKRAAAIITDRGGRTCHAAIISRELGVPCVVGTNEATASLRDAAEVTVDGSAGRVFAGAQAPLLDWWAGVQAAAKEAPADVETRTRIYVNLAEPELAALVAQRPVDGVGLLRAEFMIAQIGEHPRSFVESGRGQEFITRLGEGMRTIAFAFAPRPVIYRATDFKTNEYANLKGGAKYEPLEENPMLGYRGAARYIQEPDLFALELEALKRVRRDFPNLHLMIPFVRTPTELRAVVRLTQAAGLERGRDFQIWMMVEIPSNIFLLDEFIDVGIDGISIGSNDLTQLILGIDRDSERFAEQFDERDPAVLKALETAIVTAKRRGITVSICGQGPSEHPDLTERLVHWGITSVSVTPDMIDKTRRIVAEAEAHLTA